MSIKSSRNSRRAYVAGCVERHGEKFFEHVDLKPYSWAGVGGLAEFMIVVETVQELIDTATEAAAYNVPYQVIAGGSGVLMSDFGFNGLIILNRSTAAVFLDSVSQVVVDSGIDSRKLINTAAAKALGGIEPLFSIPGSVGGAIITGAWRDRFAFLPFVRSLTYLVFDNDEPRVVTVSPTQIESQLGQARQKKWPSVLLTAHLQLTKLSVEEIVRRLSLYSAPAREQPNMLGYCFKGEPMEQLINDGVLKGVGGVPFRMSRQNLEIFELEPQARATDQRQALERICRLAYRTYGRKLELRTHFLGYWPDDEARKSKIENATSSGELDA